MLTRLLFSAALMLSAPVAACAEYIVAAGRSPIPIPGETITKPIPAVRLQPENLPTPPSRPISWQEAATYTGQQVTIEGKVIDTGKSGQLAFLNFTQYRPGSKDFSVVVFQEAASALPAPADKHFLNKWVRVTGPVTVHKERPNIEVRDAAAIQIIDGPSAPAPTATATASGAGAIPWTEAPAHVGKTITATGTIVDTKNLGNLCFLNFSNDRQGFYVVVFKEAFASLPAAPETYYKGKAIKVTGEVSMHKGRPQIQVRDAKQIVVE